MHRIRRLRALSCLAAVIVLAACGEKSPTRPLPGTIGPDGGTLEFALEPTRFAEPVQLTIEYDPAGRHRVAEDPGQQRQSHQLTVTGPITGLGVLAILGMPVATVAVAPDRAAIGEGDRTQLAPTVGVGVGWNWGTANGRVTLAW